MITQREALSRRYQDALERALIKQGTTRKKRHVLARETMEHVLLECEDICPAADLDSTVLLEALGFSESREKVNTHAIEISKGRLEVWWKKSRETTNNGGVQKQSFH